MKVRTINDIKKGYGRPKFWRRVIFAVLSQSAKSAKVMRLENTALYGISGVDVCRNVLRNCVRAAGRLRNIFHSRGRHYAALERVDVDTP